jgi:toxin-antitoxin system PIN domain toxin
VIVPDLNLLVYAYSAAARLHVRARAWWQDLLGGEEPVGLPWHVSVSFVRLMTSTALHRSPWTADQAIAAIEAWHACPNTLVIDPGPRHLALLRALLAEAGAAGNLTTDAHLAALAIEHNATLHSNDADFGRFSGLRWVNPLAG